MHTNHVRVFFLENPTCDTIHNFFFDEKIGLERLSSLPKFELQKFYIEI